MSDEAEIAQLRQELDAAKGSETLALQWMRHAEREEALADEALAKAEAKLAIVKQWGEDWKAQAQRANRQLATIRAALVDLLAVMDQQ